MSVPPQIQGYNNPALSHKPPQFGYADMSLTSEKNLNAASFANLRTSFAAIQPNAFEFKSQRRMANDMTC